MIFTAHFDAVRACCVRRLPSDEANDAVAEVSLVVWPRIDAVPFDTTCGRGSLESLATRSPTPAVAVADGFACVGGLGRSPASFAFSVLRSTWIDPNVCSQHWRIGQRI